MFRRHPETTFIAAHLAWLGHDLGRLGQLLDEIPNMNVGLGAVIYEPGRQPRFAREFFIEYQDRILMGKDSWAPDEYPTYFRVLETADEYFPYYRRYHAFWRMYGLDLPDEGPAEGLLRERAPDHPRHRSKSVPVAALPDLASTEAGFRGERTGDEGSGEESPRRLQEGDVEGKRHTTRRTGRWPTPLSR